MFYKKGETTEDEEQMDEEQIMSGLEVDEDDAESGEEVVAAAVAPLLARAETYPDADWVPTLI